MLYVDIPTIDDVRDLRAQRADPCLSIYVPTTPITADIETARIEFKNAVRDAESRLEAEGVNSRVRAALLEELDDLLDDDDFWQYQAHSLAVLATVDTVRTFRLANRLPAALELSDRFYLKPLLRSITFPHQGFVLALSENAVRLVEIFADIPAQRVAVADLPRSAADAIGVSSINNRVSGRKVMGGEGQKVRLAQYARIVDRAIRPVIAGQHAPLILAANQPLDAIYRSITSNSSLLAPEPLRGTDDRTSDEELGVAAREILDRVYTRDMDAFAEQFNTRKSANRATTDLAEAARAATLGAIETLVADLETVTRGTIDEQTGVISLADANASDGYDIVDEIMGRALVTGAQVKSARAADIPGGGSLAATLRYPL